MSAVQLGIIIAVLVICLRAVALRGATALVLAWVRIYSLGLPADVRDSRLNEMKSHLWEQEADSRKSGYSPDLTAVQIALQLILGLPQDFTWRVGMSRTLMARRQRSEVDWGSIDARLFSCVYSAAGDPKLASDVTDRCLKWLKHQKAWQNPDWEILVFSKAIAELRAERDFGRRSGIGLRAPSFLRQPDDAISATRLDLIYAAIGRLPANIREVLALKFDAELTNEQIAAILGITVANARVRVFQAVRLLRREVGDERAGAQKRDDEGDQGAAPVSG